MNENELTHAIAREHINLASGLLAMMVPQAEGAGIGLKGLDGRYRLAPNSTLWNTPVTNYSQPAP